MTPHHMFFKDGDTLIDLTEVQSGVYEVTLKEGQQALVQFYRGLDFPTACQHFRDAIGNEIDQYVPF